MWVDAHEVAPAPRSTGWSRDRRVIVPGVFNKVGAAAYQQTFPRRLLLPILTRSHPGLKKGYRPDEVEDWPATTSGRSS